MAEYYSIGLSLYKCVFHWTTYTDYFGDVVAHLEFYYRMSMVLYILYSVQA